MKGVLEHARMGQDARDQRGQKGDPRQAYDEAAPGAGQMQGGVVQGIGWALNEEYYMADDGATANTSLLDYRMPTALDLPMIETILVEVPNPLHPFGVRGVAEAPIVPPLGAVANAIADATGHRFLEAPIKPSAIVKWLIQTEQT